MDKKVAFLTEMEFYGNIPADHLNMRTEFAWMHATNADHHNIHSYEKVVGYDVVVLLLPQGKVVVDCHGVELNRNHPDKLSGLLNTDFINILKNNNGMVVNMQEGPAWLFNEYEIETQFQYYNVLSNCDVLLAHNNHDARWYRGLLPNKKVYTMPTLLIETLISEIVATKENKTVMGGNFARWYGGFQTFVVSQEFENDIWVHSSHATRTNEQLISGLHHLPRLNWYEWMKFLSTCKYAIHLMPTVAAGTFSLNCAYFGIPCIGNKRVDTQLLCHPNLAVDVDDVESARRLAHKLKTDSSFYGKCSTEAKENYRAHYDIESWKLNMKEVFYG